MSKIVPLILFLLTIGIIAFITNPVYALDSCQGPIAETRINRGGIWLDDPNHKPILIDTDRLAEFYINIGDNKKYPSYKMQFKCGINTPVTPFEEKDAKLWTDGASIYANLDKSSTSLGSPCEFTVGTHEIIVKNSSGEQCVSTYTVNDRNPFIPTIGDIDPDHTAPLTIYNLAADTMYSIGVEKLTAVDERPLRIFGENKKYTLVFLGCLKPNDYGQIELNNAFTFLRIPGFYTMKLSKGHMEGNACKPDDKPITTQEFTVGGPTNIACCNLGRPIYIRGSDLCGKIHLITDDTDETDCSKQNPKTYCEPQSLKCFKKKTSVSGDRICKEPQPGTDFDLTRVPPIGLDKYAVCGASGGQEIKGCNETKRDPKDPTKILPNPHPAIATAIGCIPTNPPELIQAFMTFIIGISGGLAFLLMILGAFQMLTSAGNPETLHAGRERLTSAIIGLLIVIFATLLLQIIGFDILQIPGFER